MSDFINDLADYLAAHGVGTVATDIFAGEMPPDPDNLVALFGAPGQVIGDQREVPSLNFPRVQAVVRNSNYENGSAKLLAVRTALHGLYGVTMGGWRVLRCHADQEGGPIGSDAQNRFEFSINFSAEINAE